MLPRASRLTRDSEFKLLFKKGRRAASAHLRLTFLANHQNFSRFGFIVSKKQASQIVMRNRIKRIMRDAVSRSLKQVHPGSDVIIQGQPNIKTAPPALIREELTQLLRKNK